MSGKRRLTALDASATGTTREVELLAPENEYLDPNPDIHTLFLEYNTLFFDGKLAGCEIKWSKRMTLCAGLCSYQPSSGFCSIRLSEPLLKLRPRSDLVNTLLHEMIHAFLFVSSPVRDHDDHGPLFQAHMHRINQRGGASITVYHTFHDEVDACRQHWWQCNGPCRKTPPYFGLVKRAMNRAPGPTDRWWPEHQARCGGIYTKIKEPASFTAKQEKARSNQKKKRAKASPSVDSFFPVLTQDDDNTNKPNKNKKKGKVPQGTTEMVTPPRLPTSEPTSSTTSLPSWKRDIDSLLLQTPPDGMMVVMGDDGELLLMNGAAALASRSPGSGSTRVTRVTSRSDAVVDLTASDDEEELKADVATTTAMPMVGAGVATPSQRRQQVIEID